MKFTYDNVEYEIKVRHSQYSPRCYVADVYRLSDSELMFAGDSLYYDPDECKVKELEAFYDYASDSRTS